VTAPAKRKTAAQRERDTAAIKAAQDRAARKARAREQGNERAAQDRARRAAEQLVLPMNPGNETKRASTPPAAPRSTQTARTARPLKNVRPAPTPPAEYDLGSAIRGLNVEFVQCRDFGHSWRPFSARWLPFENCFQSVLRCARCSTTRTRYLGPRGQLQTAHYEYADGYQLPPGAGHLSSSDRDQIRLASIQAVLIEDTVQE
jgi:hypothetical protein